MEPLSRPPKNLDVLTREAFIDYHLSPNGTVYFTRPEYQLPRLLATEVMNFASTTGLCGYSQWRHNPTGRFEIVR